MKLFHKIYSLIRNLPLTLTAAVVSTPDRVQHVVPYVSQFANPSWAEMVLKDDQPLSRDLFWEASGARSIKEYERWALSICGMACTAMLLQFFNRGVQQTIPLARDAAAAGVYKKDGEGISPMQYRPYVKWLKKFNLHAKIENGLTFRSICYLLSKKRLVIASVNPNIRGFATAPKPQVGGHLILLTGYNKKDKTITFHNPSGFENDETQQNHTIRVQDFMIYFAGRGIAVQDKS